MLKKLGCHETHASLTRLKLVSANTTTETDHQWSQLILRTEDLLHIAETIPLEG